jgi:small subunit ribosomal protein S20
MANIKSAEKRIRQTAKRTLRNRAARTSLRSAIKKYRAADNSARAGELPGTYSEIDRALRKGIIHKNAAARYKSRLAKTAPAAAPAKKGGAKR